MQGKPLVWLFLSLAFGLTLAAQSEPAQEPGPEACAICHEDLVKGFQKTAHQVLGSKKGKEHVACSSCHGSGIKHAESADPALIRNPRKLRVTEADATCNQCHTAMKRQNLLANSHSRAQVACFTCHSVHGNDSKSVEPLLRSRLVRPSGAAEKPLLPHKGASVNQMCTSCHTAEWANFQLPHGHPVARNAMSCTDCHSPHGSTLNKQIRNVTSNQPACFNCHGDKRGPFAFPHAPMTIDGCGTCHTPHNSANPFMLTRHEVRFQCLECHANTTAAPGGAPPAFHDLRSPRYANCTTCHVKIHGSHIDKALLK